jgi:hypothetical protein
MTSTAIPTVCNPAIPMPVARAVFILAHANESRDQAGTYVNLIASSPIRLALGPIDLDERGTTHRPGTGSFQRRASPCDKIPEVTIAI